MPDTKALEEYYATLTDQGLLNLGAEGGFTAEAEQVYARELARRNLSARNIKQYAAASERSKLRDEVIERGGGYRSPGLQFFGNSFLNESDRGANIQVRTKWFTISGIPLVPIASYRFKAGTSFSANAQRNVINRVPIFWPQVFGTFLKTVGWIMGAALLVGVLAWILSGVMH